MMRYLLPAAIVLLLPVLTRAETVAVLSVTYTEYTSASFPKERTDKLKEAVLDAIENVGMTPLDLEDGPEGGGAFAGCANATCAGNAARKAGADIGIVVSVVDKEGEFEIVIHLSTHPSPVSATPFCSFNSMLQRVAGFVESALQESRRHSHDDEESPPEEEKEQPKREKNTAEEPDEDSQTVHLIEETPMKRPKPLSPIPFYTMIGATVVFGGSYAAIESYAYSKSKDTEDKSDLRPFQIANYALLGCTVASGIAAVVLVFFTDFKSRKGSKRDPASASLDLFVVPSASPGGLGLSVSGRF